MAGVTPRQLSFLIFYMTLHLVASKADIDIQRTNRRSTPSGAKKVNCHGPIGLQHRKTMQHFTLAVSSGTAGDLPLHGPKAWIASKDDVVYIELGARYIVTGIQTQGNPLQPEWLTSYQVDYADSCDQSEFNYVTDEKGNAKNFRGNSDQNTVVTNLIDRVVEAGCVVVTVNGYHGNNSALRMELLGCKKSDCKATTLGLDNSLSYRNEHFTSNSPSLDSIHLPSSARPIGRGWIPRDSRGSWIQVQLPSEKILCGVLLLQDSSETRAVRTYTISVSRNCMEFRDIVDQDDRYIYNDKKVFEGPTWKTAKKVQMFPKAERASCVRIHPQKVSRLGALVKLDLIGCGTGRGIPGGCGGRKSHWRQKRIIGGDISWQGQWPWLVSMRQFNKRAACGAAIIDANWLVTAAHCVAQSVNGYDMIKPENWKIRLGEHYVSEAEGTSYDVDLEQIIPHPDYDYVTKNNDIALLKIKTPLHFSDYINKICLPEVGTIIRSGDECYVAGWGMIDYEMMGYAKVLRHVLIKVITNEECKEMYASIGYNVTPEMICAGSSTGGKDSCTGDSGGPLTCLRNGVWVATGVVSFGQGCGSSEYPGVYTRMTSYLDWMEAVIRND